MALKKISGLLREKRNRRIVKQFHKFYYDANESGGTWKDTFWMGTRTAKCPLDLWIYQEIIFEERPDVIIESGTYCGGTTLFLANVCDAVNKGRILTVDIEDSKGKPQHKRITYLVGSSTAEGTVEKIRRMIGSKDKVMVILDSEHHKGHVLNELELYSRFVSKGGYLIVEDTNLNGNPVLPGYGAGPMEAIQEFLKDNKDFVIDKTREKLYLTFNPNGFLQRIN